MKRINNCAIAKEIWDTLIVMFGGTKRVQDGWINRLQEYEMFKMNDGQNNKWNVWKILRDSLELKNAWTRSQKLQYGDENAAFSPKELGS